MATDCIPLSAIPHRTRLFADYIAHFERVREFYARPPLARDWLPAEARLLRYDDSRRARAAGILERQNRTWDASAATLDNIRRLAAGASAVVTGQQVGLFGGPLFSFYKALSAIRLAAEMSQSGNECVPVFWLATEDHDLAEVNHATLPGAEAALVKLTSGSAGKAGAPVSAVRFGPEIEGVVAEAAKILGDTPTTQFLRDSYRPGESLGSSFARLFSRLFAHSGVVLLDASDPELHAVAAPIYQAAIANAEELDRALLERGRSLEAAGYHVQVKVTPSSTLLFGLRDGGRLPVHRANHDFTLGEEKLGEGELLRRIAAQPGEFSANVLLRPVVQDYLLPTVAYVGGPSEVAYFAQAGVVYQKLLGRLTPVLPRFSATLVEPRAQRLLERYHIAVADTFHGPERLRELLAARSLPADVSATFESAERSLQESLAEVRTALQKLDPTLAEAAGHAASKMEYQLTGLRQRAARAELRRSEEIARHADLLTAALYPDRDLQERQLAGVSFTARYGTELLLRLYDAAHTSCPDHQVIPL
ncbi:MAG TPA: bacillithiol biosynthesis cysteine-adding enzyme BshC [Terriglobales bacterium]|nr:bacillithiol biosynthesis cysteine-adding enzyme BshC [Terriglobales bacterium]